MIIFTDKFVPKRFGAICVGPFIFIRKKFKYHSALPEIIAHEKVHIKQQQKLLWVGHWVMYAFSKKYRLKSEVEAYKVSLQHGLPVKCAAKWLSTKYNLSITYHDAVNLLVL